MICARCLKVVCDPEDVKVDAESIVTCLECLAEEAAYHEAEWSKNREPWAEDGCPDPSKDCGCANCAAQRMDAAESKWEAEQGK